MHDTHTLTHERTDRPTNTHTRIQTRTHTDGNSESALWQINDESERMFAKSQQQQLQSPKPPTQAQQRQSNRCIHTHNESTAHSSQCKHNEEHDHIFHVTFRPFAVLIFVSSNVLIYVWCAHHHRIILSLFVVCSRCHTHDSDHLSSLSSALYSTANFTLVFQNSNTRFISFPPSRRP